MWRTSSCNRMEWVHSNTTGNSRFFYCTWIQNYETCLLSNMLLIFTQVHSQISVMTNIHTVTININVTVHINKHQEFIITSSKYTYIQFNVHSVVHSIVYLSSSVPSSSLIQISLFPSQIYSSLTMEWQMQWLMHFTWGFLLIFSIF